MQLRDTLNIAESNHGKPSKSPGAWRYHIQDLS
jgi:hypothetical protein